MTVAVDKLRGDPPLRSGHPVEWILDLDGALLLQEPVRRRLATGAASRIDCRDLGRSLRLWAWDRDFDALRRRLPPPGSSAEIFLVGSGDYHHVTAALIERRPELLTIVHLDNHPDWAWTFPRRHCGSWVNAALDLHHVARVVTIGCSSEDLAHPDRRGVNLRSLRSGRLEMHPWYVPPTPLGDDRTPVPGHAVVDGELVWSNFAGRDWDDAVAALVRGLPTRDVWLSIDKDVLAPEFAATNWDQSALPLACLERLVTRLADSRRIVGVDICGDYSPARHLQPMKVVEALIDQPRRVPADLSVNARTNARLLDLLEAVL